MLKIVWVARDSSNRFNFLSCAQKMYKLRLLPRTSIFIMIRDKIGICAVTLFWIEPSTLFTLALFFVFVILAQISYSYIHSRRLGAELSGWLWSEKRSLPSFETSQKGPCSITRCNAFINDWVTALGGQELRARWASYWLHISTFLSGSSANIERERMPRHPLGVLSVFSFLLSEVAFHLCVTDLE